METDAREPDAERFLALAEANYCAYIVTLPGTDVALMLAIMGTASGRRSLTGRWICIVLGSASFVALIHLITS